MLAGLIFMMAAVGGCDLLKGAYGDKNDGGNSPPVGDAITVQIIDFAFEPQVITVKVGTTVTWVQNDSVPHTVTSTSPADIFDSGRLEQNEVYTFTFENVGTFDYFCEIHPSMTGTVVVEP